MPRFSYRAKDSAFKVIEGVIEADNEAAAISQLGHLGVFPIAVAEAGDAPRTASGGTPRRRVPKRQVTYATRQLADLLGGGLPLLRALRVLAQQTEHLGLRYVVNGLADAVQEGRSFSEALAAHPAIFPPLYVSMVRAGETGGGMEQGLARLADLGEADAELRGRLLSASAYPLLVLALSTVAIAVLIGYVIPQLSSVFIESGQVLPLPTQILLTISRLFSTWWWAVLLGVVGLVWGAKLWYASPEGKALWDRVFVALPGVGILIRKLETARFTRTLGTMVSQGVPVLQALEVVGRNLSNAVLRQAVGGIQEAVREGSSIATAIAASNQFPVFVSNMVAVGEESGTVDAALLKVATTYDREVDRVIQALITVVEPVLLVGVGGVVMFIVLAILLPVFQIGLVVQ